MSSAHINTAGILPDLTAIVADRPQVYPRLIIPQCSCIMYYTKPVTVSSNNVSDIQNF